MFEKFEYYPLLISALAGLIAEYRPAPKDFDRWLQDNVEFDVFAADRRLVKDRVLRFALAGLEPAGDLVLRVLSALLMPTSYDTLARLLVGPSRAITTEEEFDRVLTELEDRGLLGWDRSNNRYDLHPVVRGVTWSRLPKELQRDAHMALRHHFSSVKGPSRVRTFDDLAGRVQEFDSLVGLGEYDAAAEQFEEHIQHLTRFRLKAFRQRRELLAALLRAAERSDAVRDEFNLHYVCLKLGETDVVIGRYREAAPALRKALAYFEGEDPKRAEESHYYLGCALAGMGRYRDAFKSLETAYRISCERKDRYQAGLALRGLSDCAYETGNFDLVLRWAPAGLKALLGGGRLPCIGGCRGLR